MNGSRLKQGTNAKTYWSMLSLTCMATITGYHMHLYKANATTVKQVVRNDTHSKRQNHVTPQAVPSDAIQNVVVSGLRKFPFPYNSMLALASDADHETLRKFNLIHQFLNTTQMTPMGRGLGLDVSDSFFMYNASNLDTTTDAENVPLVDQFTWFKGTSNVPYGATVIDKYIRDGWMDSIHTFGDFSMKDQSTTEFSRSLAKSAIDALKHANDQVTVWIDHGNASNVDNFGSFGIAPFYKYQQGASPGSPYFHTDLTIPYGIKFVWTDESSDIFGHATMVYPLHLPSGQNVWGFWRYNIQPSSDGSETWVWSADSLSKELTQKNLSSIEWNHQYAVVAQHFSSDNAALPLPKTAIASLKLLANEYHRGKILVARTSRLLAYNVTQEYVRYNVSYGDGRAVIHIRSIDDPVFGSYVPTVDDLHGLTFYTSNPKGTQIDIGNTPIDLSYIQQNNSDGISPSIEIKWYAVDTKDYAVKLPGVY